jgi:hypothetical protein
LELQVRHPIAGPPDIRPFRQAVALFRHCSPNKPGALLGRAECGDLMQYSPCLLKPRCSLVPYTRSSAKASNPRLLCLKLPNHKDFNGALYVTGNFQQVTNQNQNMHNIELSSAADYAKRSRFLGHELEVQDGPLGDCSNDLLCGSSILQIQVLCLFHWL